MCKCDKCFIYKHFSCPTNEIAALHHAVLNGTNKTQNDYAVLKTLHIDQSTLLSSSMVQQRALIDSSSSNIKNVSIYSILKKKYSLVIEETWSLIE